MSNKTVTNPVQQFAHLCSHHQSSRDAPGHRSVPQATGTFQITQWLHFSFTSYSVQHQHQHHHRNYLIFNSACHFLSNAQTPLFPLTFSDYIHLILWKHIWGCFSAKTSVADCTLWFCYLMSCFASSFCLILCLLWVLGFGGFFLFVVACLVFPAGRSTLSQFS